MTENPKSIIIIMSNYITERNEKMSNPEKRNFDLTDVTTENSYEKFHVEGNEAEALTDSYYELFKLLGADAVKILYTYCRGDKIDCPMKLYRAEYIADLVEKETDRRRRADIARHGGYALKFIESVIQKRKKTSEK